MKNIVIVPADTYTVINKSIITEQDKKIVSMLYQPIIGFAATSLYTTLLSSLQEQEWMSEDLTHHHLMSTMQLKLEDIVIAREKLEAIGLLKTYMKKDNINQYVYCLYSPLEANDFFNHPILNIVLYNNIGKKEYERLLNQFKIPSMNLKEYEDITSSFDEVFQSVKGTLLEQEQDITKRDSNNIEIHKGVDFNLIESSIPESQRNEKCFNEETKNLINSLSYIYHISTLDMQGIVRACLNEKGFIDKNELRKSCRNYYQFENAGNLPTLIYNKQPDFLKKPEGDTSKWAKMVYTFENITPYQLLKAKYKGAEPTDRDKRLVESLLIDQKLNPGVVNVLISYVLKTNNEQLKKSYVETIAGQWKRSNVETVEEAMKIAEKYHKKMKKQLEESKEKKETKKPLPEKQVPAWFQKEQTLEEATDEEMEELDKILTELV
ncbi:MAG: DnaD domain protein [Bacilli bacterium]|nr:DnaD domain protein [Bacilli bacterium]